MKLLFTFIFAVPLAAQTVGVVASAGPVTLSGTLMEGAGVVSWPVFAGDDVVAGATPALVALRDGSQIVLNPTARIRIETRVSVLAGSIFVACPRDCSLVVTAKDRTIAFKRGDRATVSILNGSAALVRGVALPPFDIPAGRLLERLPYTMGIYLP